MRKQIKPSLEIGDVNYVKPGEFFVTLSADGKTPTSVQRRKDNLDMETILGQGGGSDNVISITSAQEEDLRMNGYTELPEMSAEWLSNFNSKEVILKIDDSDEPEHHYPVWDEYTINSYLRFTESALDDADLVFGGAYTPTYTPTYGIIFDDEVGGYILFSCQDRFGFLPCPYFGEVTGAGLPSLLGGSEPYTVLYTETAWFDIFLDPNNYAGIMLGDNNFYPFYNSTVSSAAYNALGGDTTFGSGNDVFFLGFVVQGQDTITQSGQQIAIWCDHMEMDQIKVANVTGWGAAGSLS